MNKLRNKIFYTILGILTGSLLGFLLVFNVQNYGEQKDVIRRNLNANIFMRNPFGEANNRNIRFMDANAFTIRLDSNDNIVEVINHSNEDITTTKIKEIATSILSSENLEKEHIGFLYFDNYSYSYHKGQSLVVIDNHYVQSKLKEV